MSRRARGLAALALVACGGDPPCEGPEQTWYADHDGDGYGDPATGQSSCAAPYRSVRVGGDCDDLSSNAHPGGREICDGRDNDCNGAVDETTDPDRGAVFWYLDEDGDGYGTASAPFDYACAAPPGRSAYASDCDDADPTVHPGAADVDDGIDNNCDGLVDKEGRFSGEMRRETAVSRQDPADRNCVLAWDLSGVAMPVCEDCDLSFVLDAVEDLEQREGSMSPCGWTPLTEFALGLRVIGDTPVLYYGTSIEAWYAFYSDYYGYSGYYGYYGYYSYYGYSGSGGATSLLEQLWEEYPSGYFWERSAWAVAQWDGTTVRIEYGYLERFDTGEDRYNTDWLLIEGSFE